MGVVRETGHAGLGGRRLARCLQHGWLLLSRRWLIKDGWRRNRRRSRPRLASRRNHKGRSVSSLSRSRSSHVRVMVESGLSRLAATRGAPRR